MISDKYGWVLLKDHGSINMKIRQIRTRDRTTGWCQQEKTENRPRSDLKSMFCKSFVSFCEHFFVKLLKNYCLSVDNFSFYKT